MDHPRFDLSAFHSLRLVADRCLYSIALDELAFLARQAFATGPLCLDAATDFRSKAKRLPPVIAPST